MQSNNHRSSALFDGVPAGVVESLWKSGEELHVHRGGVLFHQGTPVDRVHVVRSGNVALLRNRVPVGRCRRGECVDEAGVVGAGIRTVTAIAQNDTNLHGFDPAQFQEALRASPELAARLAASLAARYARELSARVDLALELEQLHRDLHSAHELEMAIYPAPELATENMAVSAYSRTAGEVGGDYYDYLPLDDGCWGMIIGDVTGHGIDSGLLVAMSKTCLHMQARIDSSPPRVMAAMDRMFAMLTRNGLMMSCCYVRIDPARHCLSYANAGHVHPYHFRRASGTLVRLAPLDPLLGVHANDGGTFEQRDSAWNSGDLLLLYTDGLTEARNSEGHMFEHGRLVRTLVQHRDASARQIKRLILRSHARHCEGLDQSDDLTLVVAKAA